MIIVSQKIKNNQIKFIEIIFYMMKINKNRNIKKNNKCVSYKQFGDYWKESHKGKQIYN